MRFMAQMDGWVGNVTGLNCTQHPSGRFGDSVLTPFPTHHEAASIVIRQADRFACVSGLSIRAASIRRAWLNCGARLCWHERCCAVKLEAIGTIHSSRDSWRIRVPDTRSMHISRQFMRRQRPGATYSTRERSVQSGLFSQCRRPPGKCHMNGSI